MAELRIPIIVENKGKKAFKDTDSSIKKLNKSFAKLAGAAGIGLSTAAVINFGKQAAKAFIADEKAASQLAQSVKNLGLAFETPRIEEFIANLSRASGVADDVLRPSMQKLLQTTGSVSKSTQLLTQALDISRGSGIDYETVISDLTAAYVGQTRGLRKYSLGLSATELKTMKFADVQERLNKQFAGSNAAYLDTYAGKMQILGTAAGEAQETIGKGLIDALMILSGDTTVEDLAETMQTLADNTAAALINLGKFGKGVQDTVGPIAKVLEQFIIYTQPIFDSIVFGDPLRFPQQPKATVKGMGGYPSSALGGSFIDPNEAARKKAEAEALKRAKALAALQAKSLADNKKKLALEKASRVLELDRINIAAALKGQISETDRLSLNLQLALLDKNDTAATKLSAELTEAVKRQTLLNALLLATPEAPNPYRNWVAPSMGASSMVGAAPSQAGGAVVPDFNVPANSFSQVGPMGGLGAGVIAGVNPQINITVELDGQAVGGAIRDSQINDSLSGSFNQTNRFSNKQGTIAI